MVALILAGGQGTRLGKLTRETAKPAVPFAGRYRIIDFALSNCANSHIHEVGVITQYQPLELNKHIGNGGPWGLNRRNGGAKILQPYTSSEGEKWFEGTAHAIYQNISYIASQNPEYVLILSGDHIYKMNYEKMLENHKKTNASLTIAVIEVPKKEASRFGIMNTDDTMRIIEFQEKPKEPKSNLASMGIYIFNWDTLRTYLEREVLNDFGKDVIPMYLNNNEAVYAYPFKGYWKDVGTIESLWEANMEFLDPNHSLNIRDDSWRIYTRTDASPAQYLTKNSTVTNALIGDGCYVDGAVENSLLAQDVYIDEKATVKNSVIMSNVTIEKGAIVDYAILGENAKIGAGQKVIGTLNEIRVIGYDERVKD